MLAADGQLPVPALDGILAIGELALSGRLRPVRGALSAALLARELGCALLLPAGWDFDHLFGVQFAAAERDLPMRESQKERQRLELPNTSTGYMLTLSLGLLLLLAGAGYAVWWRRFCAMGQGTRGERLAERLGQPRLQQLTA